MLKPTGPKKSSLERGPRASRATSLFGQGFNCSQAVLAAYAPSLGLKRDKAFRLAQGFGAGMARLGETCGAVTGAIMVIGLKYGKVRAKDDASKEKTYRLVREFMDRFRSRHGSLRCKVLLGHDLGSARGQKLIMEQGLHDTLCPKFIRTAVVILEKML
ncbi:MAG: C-GCAxxG-C-C family protein [Candidatus Aminicenantales bacterium]